MAIAFAICVVRGFAACVATPDLEFASEAASPDPVDGGSDVTASEGSADDANDVADAAADAPRNTCPDATPPRVDQCCGRVRCVGDGCADNRCAECRLCSPLGVCCIRKADAGADCVATIAACR
jgi:hypothetical protein